MIDLTGKTLANRYDLLALIGTGGMGAVYRARDRELDELVALKVIRHDLAALPQMGERFRHEVKLARRVTHVNVARTFELGSADGVMFCTMELIEGESLTVRLGQRRRLPVGEAVPIAIAMCEALEAAHAAGVIHRDIKPDNVLLAHDGRVVLADFGVAAVAAAEGELSGTPAYMAPEQARGEAPSPAADVYAVGAVLAEMLAGRRAFSGDVATILAAKQDLEHVALAPGEASSELAQVIAQATARDRDKRIGSAAALARALSTWARPARAATQPHVRPAIDSDELRTVYVVGARGFDRPKLYLASAVHEQLLAKLRRVPRIRVLARYGELGDAPEDTKIVVDVDADETIHVRVTPPGLAFEVPARIDQVAPAVELAARAIDGALASEPMPATALEVEDLILRARHMLHDNVRDTPRAMELLEQGVAMAPNEPRLIANLAIAHVRMAFFLGETNTTSLARATELARQALAIAPQLADSHIAAAHVALNTGDAVEAAVQFRTAIACAPHLTEAHEQLGRLLLEAGYIDVAMARLEDTLRIAIGPRMVRWDIGRAWVLEGRFDDYLALEAELMAEGRDRPNSRARYLWWRGDLSGLREFRTWFEAGGQMALVAEVARTMLRVFLDGDYAGAREPLIEFMHGEKANARRRAFVAQMATEAAAYAGDLDTAFLALATATDAGLFDLHWLDKCQLLEPLRSDPRFGPLRASVKARAESILDALYGDRGSVATSDTVAATS
ncbi:MAG: protein kinase [Deltaproteobacteria bacterium]|nr:protein kinase [Deltaproteobacteria bacterium]